MSFQLIWKRLITNKVPLSSPRVSIPISLLRPLAINAKPDTKIAKFCTETATPPSTPPDRGAVTDILINKYGMTEEEVSKTFKNSRTKGLLYASSKDLEEVLELLNECGLTTLAHIRKLVFYNLRVIAGTDLKSRLSFLRSVMNEDDMCQLLSSNPNICSCSEDKLRSGVSLLQRLGLEGEALSKLVAMDPRLLMTTDENVIESFKVVEGLGLEKGSHVFGLALRALLGVGKEKLDLRLQCLRSLGFSERQISELSSRSPCILGVTEEKLRRNVDFLVKSVGFSLDDLTRYSSSLTCSLEKRIIPRYIVMEALKYMKVLETERISPHIIIYMTDKHFLEKYVNWNAESSSALQDIYYGRKAGIVDDRQGDSQ